MSLKDTEMHVVSMLGAGLLSAALIVPVVFFYDDADARGPALADDRQVIEATLAFKSEKPKQPQKKRDVVEEVKVEGVSRDENKKVEEKKEDKKDEKKPVVDPKDPFKGLRRPDEDAGKPTTQPEGDFNGSEKGFAPESRGDPFLGELRADMNFQFPEIAKAQSIPVGCIHLQPDGRIKATTFAAPIGKQGDDDLQTAAEAALRELQKNRNRSPKAVPTHLLSITKQWLCFRFNVSSE
jgi:hypothetical protein